MSGTKSKIFATALLLTGIAAVGTSDAAVQAGVLTCRAGASVGMILGSVRPMECVFRPSDNRQPTQRYSASISTIGVDIGFTSASQMAWAVFAPTSRVGAGDLAGTYVGGTASAAFGFGAGSNALVGGSANSIALQPVSFEGSLGVRAAGGIGGLTLNYAGGR